MQFYYEEVFCPSKNHLKKQTVLFIDLSEFKTCSINE